MNTCDKEERDWTEAEWQERLERWGTPLEGEMIDLGFLKILLAEASPEPSPDNATDWWFTASNHSNDKFDDWHVCRQLEGRTSQQFGPMPLLLAEEIKDRLNQYHETSYVLGPLARCVLALGDARGRLASNADYIKRSKNEGVTRRNDELYADSIMVWVKEIDTALAALAESAGQCAETEALTECPKCHRKSVESVLSSGRRFCLYAADCGWSAPAQEQGGQGRG